MLKEDARSPFHRLPYISDKGQGYYLDLLVLPANAHSKGKNLFWTFLKAIVMHVNDSLTDYNHYIPLREDEPEEDEEWNVEDDDEDDEVGDMEEDDWFVYPRDLTYEDDSNDSDFEL